MGDQFAGIAKSVEDEDRLRRRTVAIVKDLEARGYGRCDFLLIPVLAEVNPDCRAVRLPTKLYRQRGPSGSDYLTAETEWWAPAVDVAAAKALNRIVGDRQGKDWWRSKEEKR